MQIAAPTTAENGAVIPIEIQLDPPLRAGQILKITVNSNFAAELLVVEGSVTAFLTRVKGGQATNTIEAYVTAVSGNKNEIARVSREVRATTPAGAGQGAGGMDAPPRGQYADGLVRVLVPGSGEISGLTFKAAGFTAVVGGGAAQSVNPIIGVRGDFSRPLTVEYRGKPVALTDGTAVAAPPAGRSVPPKQTPPSGGGKQASRDGGGSPPGQGGGGQGGGGKSAPSDQGGQKREPAQARGGSAGTPSGTPSATPPGTPTNSGGSTPRPGSGGSAALTEKDLAACGKEIDRFHRMALAYWMKQEEQYCKQGTRLYNAGNCAIERERRAENTALGAMRFYMQGNGSCNASDYPCFGLGGLVGLSASDLQEFSGRPTEGLPNDVEGYSFVVDQCAAKVLLAKKEVSSSAVADGKNAGGGPGDVQKGGNADGGKGKNAGGNSGRVLNCPSATDQVSGRYYRPTGPGRCPGEINTDLTNNSGVKVTCQVCVVVNGKVSRDCSMTDLAPGKSAKGEMGGFVWCNKPADAMTQHICMPSDQWDRRCLPPDRR